MWTSLNKKLYLLLGIILVIGIIVGIIFVIMLDEASKELVFTNINELIQKVGGIKVNNIINHTLILSSLIILSIFLIGIPLLLFFIFFNGFSIGFIISTLFSLFGIKGVLYSIIYILISKGIYLFLLFIISVSLIKITKYIIDIFIDKKKSNDNVLYYTKKCLVCMGIIILNDVLLYFLGTKLLNIFNFLLN